MTLTRSFIRNAPTTPLDARLMNMAGLVCNADGSPRAGVLGGATTTLVTALATMNVAVAAAEFATSKGKADGVAIFTNDGTVNVAIAAAPASNSRIDVIWVKHNDDTTGDANALPVFGVTAGVAAASPTKPAIPTGALELATLRVYAGTTAANGGANTLVNTFAMTVARGGTVPFRTKTELDAWTNPIDGQEAYVIAESSTYRRQGGAWRLWERAWATYAPTFTNVTAPAAVVKYKVDAGVVTVRFNIPPTAMGSNPSMSLPIDAADSIVEHLSSGIGAFPAAGSEVVCVARRASASSVTFYYYFISGTTVYINNIASSAPINWTNGSLRGQFQYETAA